ncbi:MAG: GDSL-type esterase/lipase family protein [Bacteroidetes bacterium]|nr:GDSL-type esterase/lipase family protein [Bacteroidota bacterium]
MTSKLLRILLSLAFILVTVTSFAQWTVTLPSGIRVDENLNNRFLFCGNSAKTYETLFRSMDDLVLRGEGIVSIIQIGDSHIQAGFLPEQMRKNFASFISAGCGARGLIFPYRIAKTNNPSDYFVKFSGKWENCRNVETNKSCILGLTGILSKTRDSLAEMTFHFRENATFRDFDFIRIFHETLDTSFRLDFPGLEGRYRVLYPLQTGYTDVRFDSVISDSLRIRIIKKDTSAACFTLYGIDFEDREAGVVYSAAGINGAEVTSYLRCDLLKDQLSKMNPGWVILSLGTNDAYPLNFKKEEFIDNYVSLVKLIRDAHPGVPVLLTVPGDSYRKRRYDNLNLVAAREAIFEVATKTDCAVWDFYTLMGGPKSIMQWYKAGLVARDKLHFDKQGYLIQADLLFGAFVNAYSSFIDQLNATE